MNRKIAAAIVAMILSVGLCGCNDAEKTQQDDNPKNLTETGENVTASVGLDSEETVELPTFEEISEKNTGDVLLEKHGAFKYVYTYNGVPEDSGDEIYTKNGVFEEEHFYEDWASEEYTTGYKFTGKNSVYRNFEGETFAVLDVTDDYRPNEDFIWYASEFYGYDPETVEKIEKIDGGWKITFKGDAETAQFFADENYQEGDLFVVEEYVDDDLMYKKCDQIMRYADGHEEIMNSTELIPCELPDIGKELSALANAENTVNATVFIDHGCGYTESHSVRIAKDSVLKVERNHFKLFADEAHTTPISEFDTSKDVIIYALSPIADYLSKEDFVNGNIMQTMIRGYDANGEEIASDGRYFDGTNPSGYSVSGDLNDENIAYFEFTTYDADGNEISMTRVDK